MSDTWEAIWGAAVAWRRTAVAACLALALAALLCLSVATGAATAAGATSSGPGTGPSVGSSLSPASSEAVRRAAAAAGRRARRRLNRLRSARSATGSSLGAVPGSATANTARPAAPATSATPPATVYTGPIRASQLGSGVLGRTGTAAKRTPAKSGTSTVAIVIGALGALLVLACAAWALARRRAYEPHWWLSLQHSLGEAGYRTSSTWAEFSDWARRGG
jgi:hypothetical protein